MGLAGAFGLERRSREDMVDEAWKEEDLQEVGENRSVGELAAYQAFQQHCVFCEAPLQRVHLQPGRLEFVVSVYQLLVVFLLQVDGIAGHDGVLFQ